MKIKSILVSQPKPESEKSPYFDLAEKHKVKIDFRKFIEVQGIPAREFRKSKVSILDHTAAIFTSTTAIDHFFRIAEEMRISIPDDYKYFCISEATAYYLQKYIVYRKRKIFYGNGRFDDLLTLIVKNNKEKFIVPLSDIHKPEIPLKLKKNKIKFSQAILYRTVAADLSDLSDVNYDILVFFSPSGITSLYENFPEFKQNNTNIAAFGPSTAKAVKEAGLNLTIEAPKPKAPSMTMALDQFIKESNKNGKK